MRSESWEELNKKKEIFYKRFPVAADIEKNLASTALQAARAVLSGSDSVSELYKLKEKNKKLTQNLKGILKSVDLPEDYLEVRHACDKCADEGFVDGMMCDCMKEMLKKESYKKLNQMSPLELSSFENFSLDYYSDVNLNSGDQSPRKRMSLILNFCRKYADNFTKNSPNLLMTGNTGLGKTHLSLAIAREVINKGYGVIYGSTQNMVSKMEKEKFRNFREENENESEHHFIDCDLLIVDDLGTEYSTAFSNAAIYNVINSRIMMNKPTIISTNLSMRELEKNYTQRMVSRIIGNDIRLEFLGSDIRQKRMKFQK
jgi:DNA replication protein DnaC